ncbi:MAG: hypothetical protein Kilf2KO_47760 [Rhodospirillales bacterium]
MSDDTSNLEDAARRERRRRLQAAQAASDYEQGLRALLATPQGRSVLRRWLAELGLFRSALAGQTDIIRNEGRREGALFIWTECRRVEGAGLVRLLQEEIEQDARD